MNIGTDSDFENRTPRHVVTAIWTLLVLGLETFTKTLALSRKHKIQRFNSVLKLISFYIEI